MTRATKYVMRWEELAEPLYVSRPVLNTDDIIAWAREQGLTSMLVPDELHVTICYSKEPLIWDDVPSAPKEVEIPAVYEFEGEDEEPVRQMELFGKEKNVLVLQVESEELHKRWQQFCDHGASYDFPEYKPHITITYKGGAIEETARTIDPYKGEVVLGPERFKKIDKSYAGDAPEFDPQEEEPPLPFDELAENVVEFWPRSELMESDDGPEWFRYLWGTFLFNIDQARRMIASGEVKAARHTINVIEAAQLLGLDPDEFGSNDFGDDRGSINIMSGIQSRGGMKGIPEDKLSEPAIIVMWNIADGMKRAGLPLNKQGRSENAKPAPVLIDGNHRLGRLFLEGVEKADVFVVPYKEALKFTYDRHQQPIKP